MTTERMPFEDLVIRASAGTGKTFQLANRYIGLLCADERPDHIFATTFARKAAGEILDRILMRLATAATNSESSNELGSFVGVENLSPERCLELLRKLIGHLHLLRVGTLDSLFSQIAGSFSLELGLPPGWRIVDVFEEQRLRDEGIRLVLQSESTASLLTLVRALNKGDVAVSVAKQMRIFVVSLYDVYREADPNSWTSLKRRKPLPTEELNAALDALRALDDFPDKRFLKARDANLQSAEANDWEAFISKGLAAKIVDGQETFYKKSIGNHILGAYEPLLGHARAKIVNRLADRTEGIGRFLEKFDAAYSQLKFRERALRFSDVTFALEESLANFANEQIGFRLDAQMEHLLLDEFQDTSLGQWNVMRPFAERVAESTDGRTFFCVGDIKQAIYRWRGGLPEIFDAVTDQLRGLKEEPLEVSYRSSPRIINVVNRVFQNLSSTRVAAKFPDVIDAWNNRFQPHQTARHNLQGHVQMLVAPRAEEQKDQHNHTLVYAAEVVARLAKAHAGCSIGVLVRTNKAVAPLIYNLRRRHAIIASEEGGNPLTDSVAVQVVLSLLKIADHHGDTTARFHVAHSPMASQIDFNDYQDDARAQRLSLEIRQSLINRGYGLTVDAWVSQLADACDDRELNRLKQLGELAYEYDRSATLRPRDFCRWVESKRIEDPTAADVRVMTVHQSKGLEFDIVVLPELDKQLKGTTPQVVVGRDDPTGPVTRVCAYANDKVQSILPSAFQEMFQKYDSQLINESLCLLYVAMTRAVHALYFVVNPSRENERSLPQTFSGVLRETLECAARLEPETIAYEDGTRHWDTRLETGSETDSSVQSAAPTTLEQSSEVVLRLAEGSQQRRRRLQRQSPSGLEGGNKVVLRKHLQLETSSALARGSLMHAWFEQIKWLDEAMPDEKRLRAIASSLTGSNLDLDKELCAFRKMLEQPTINHILSRTGYSEPSAIGFSEDVCREIQTTDVEWNVLREQPFAIRDGDHLVQGAIDRLVLICQSQQVIAADIVDFKTDAISIDDPNGIDSKVEFYRPQIEAYRRAVSKLYDLDESRIAARLLFVGSDLVRTL